MRGNQGKWHKGRHWSDFSILMRLHTQSSVKYDQRAALSTKTSCSMRDGEPTLRKADNTVRQLHTAASVPITQPVCKVKCSVCFWLSSSVQNLHLPCHAWQSVGRDEGKWRFVSLYEPNGVLTALLGVQEDGHVHAAGTLAPLQPRTQDPGATERWTVHPEELAWGGGEKEFRW